MTIGDMVKQTAKRPAATSSVLSFLGVILVFLALTGCGEALPETYGVYARSGGTLWNISDSDESNDWNISVDAEIIVFHSRITNPAFDPEKHLILNRAKFARYTRLFFHETALENADSILEEAFPRTVEKKGEWVKTTQIEVGYKPVPGRPGMLTLVPTERLNEGAYVITLKGALLGELSEEQRLKRALSGRELSEERHFGVRLGDNVENAKNAACEDNLIVKESTTESITHDMWAPCQRIDEGIPEIQKSVRELLEVSLRKLKGGHSGDDVILQDAIQIADHPWVREYLKAGLNSIERGFGGDYDTLKIVVHQIAELHPDDEELKQIMYEGLAEQAQWTLEHDKWDLAVMRANSALRYRPDDPAMLEVIRRAEEKR